MKSKPSLDPVYLTSQLMSIEIISELFASTSSAQLPQKLMEELRELTGARTILLVIFPDAPDTDKVVYTCPPRRASLFSDYEINHICSSLSLEALPCFTAELPPENPLRALLLHAGIKSLLRFLLPASGELIGTLLLLDLQEITRIDDIIKTISPLLPLIAMSLKNSLALQHIEEQAKTLEAQTRDLELIVAERTADLEASNKELSASYTTMHDMMNNAIEAKQHLEETGNTLRREVNERRRVEKKLRESLRYSRNLIESSLDPLVTISHDGKITDTNIATEIITGVQRDKLIGSDFSDYFTDPEKARGGYHEVFNHGYVKDYPLSIKNQNGQITHVLYNASLYQNEDGSTAGVFAAARDITERRQAEEEIKRLLSEKELLLREVHHRIKNNMAVISGMLALQADTLKDPSAIAALKDSQSRIRSMMVLYDKLYRSANFKEISTREYLLSLINEIIANFPGRIPIVIKEQIDDYVFDAKTLSPLGIILNELITNAMKHAFIGKKEGVITISLSIKDNHAILIIQDNGNGIPASIDIESSTGFGLQLVNMLSEQLEGTIQIEREKGTRFILEFEIQ